MRLGIAALLLAVLALALTACGGDSDDESSSEDELTPAGVQACLEEAGFGVTVVPAEDVAEGGAYNRGPGQTGQLLVGADGFEPEVGGDEADAVVAFWDSAESASSSPNAEADDPGSHAEAFGSITVQPVKLAGDPEAEEIEGCAQS